MKKKSETFTRLAEQLQSEFAETVSDLGLYLDRVEVAGEEKRPILRFFIDLPDGPGLLAWEEIERATAALGSALDAADALATPYVLEVSSLGAERALTTPRDFRRSQGLRVVVKTKAGAEIAGKLESVTAEGLVIFSNGEANKLGLEEIETARTEVDFSGMGE